MKPRNRRSNFKYQRLVIVNEKGIEWIRPVALLGIAGKMLTMDKEAKAHAILVRWDPGVIFPHHAHPCFSQTYTLEG